MYKFLVAALSLWEGANHPDTNPEYLRAQAETFTRILRSEGFLVGPGALTPILKKMAVRVFKGERVELVASEFFTMIGSC